MKLLVVGDSIVTNDGMREVIPFTTKEAVDKRIAELHDRYGKGFKIEYIIYRTTVHISVRRCSACGGFGVVNTSCVSQEPCRECK